MKLKNAGLICCLATLFQGAFAQTKQFEKREQV